jgi:hypothetical protein
LGRVTEIIDRVIVLDAIPVINDPGWPNSVNIKPSQTMSLMCLAVYLDRDVPPISERACFVAPLDPVPSDIPCELSGFLIIGELFEKSFI